MASNQCAVNEQGEKIIASSLRADGSIRKERKVRAGYVPQEEVPVYVPRHIRERNAASESMNSIPISQRRPEAAIINKNNSIPGFSESPPPRGKVGNGGGKPRGRGGVGPTQISSKSMNDAVVDKMMKLQLGGESPPVRNSTSNHTLLKKTTEDGSTSSRGSRGACFKYQPFSIRSNTPATTDGNNNQKIPPSRPPLNKNNYNNDDGPPPGFPDPWKD